MYRNTRARCSRRDARTSASGDVVLLDEQDRSVSDGPFAETKEQLAGFYLMPIREQPRGGATTPD